MGTLYSGVAASLATGVQITVPADLDPDNAATFDVGLQKLADYVEAIRAQYASNSASVFGVFNFGGTGPNTASTVSAMWNSGGQVAPGNTMVAVGSLGTDQYTLMVPAACVIKQIAIRHWTATVGGAVNILVHRSTSVGVISTLSTTVVPSGDAPSVRTAIVINAALAAGDLLYVTHETQTGVTNGGGVWQVSAQLTTA